jgi:hypothetical protein
MLASSCEEPEQGVALGVETQERLYHDKISFKHQLISCREVQASIGGAEWDSDWQQAYGLYRPLEFLWVRLVIANMLANGTLPILMIL